MYSRKKKEILLSQQDTLVAVKGSIKTNLAKEAAVLCKLKGFAADVYITEWHTVQKTLFVK